MTPPAPVPTEPGSAVLRLVSSQVLPRLTSDHARVRWVLTQGGAQWRVIQANVQYSDPLAQNLNVVKVTLDQAEVVCWNELRREEVRKHLASRDGWGFVYRGEVGVSWREARFEYVKHDVEVVHGGIAKVTPTRLIVSVLLRDRITGLAHWVQATHVVHNIDVGGKARPLARIPGQNARAKSHFSKLAASIVRHGKTAPVFGAGDLNVDYKAEARRSAGSRTKWFPYTVLGAVADIETPQAHGKGTHGSRLIDWGWVSR